jgi:hypothetical protein
MVGRVAKSPFVSMEGRLSAFFQAMDGRVTRTLFRTVCGRGKPRQD